MRHDVAGASFGSSGPMALVAAVAFTAAMPLGSLAQSCGLPPSMPYRALVKVIDDENTPSDLNVAAGLSRVVVSSNSRLRIHCKSGYAMTSERVLSAANVTNAVFAETASSFDHFHTFDPRVIYDGYDGRFWIVAAEDDLTGTPYKGRLHIAVSGAGMTDGEVPQDWSSTYWVKFTGDGTGVAGASLDPSISTVFNPDKFDTGPNPGDGHFPDRPTIAVDRDFLYISVREATPGQGADLDRMLMVVLCKADLVAGTPTVVTSQFIDTGEDRTSMHVLAVDSTIPESGVHRVYMVTLPNLYALAPGVGDGDPFDSIRVGAFTGTGTFGDCGSSLEWGYEAVDVPMDDEADEFIGMSFAAIKAKGAASGNSAGLNAQTPGSLFMNAMTRTLSDDDRRIWCIHNILPDDEADISELQWYQINLHGWPDTGSPDPDFDRVERIALDDAYDLPLNVFDGAIVANECEDVGIVFTRGAYYNSGTSTWTYPQFWKALYPYGSSPTIAVVTAGASQYYDPGNIAWADYAGMAADPDPGHTARFYGLHMTGHDDDAESGGIVGQRTKAWEGWLASFTFGSCDSGSLADFDEDQDVDGDDLGLFEVYASEDNMAADLDQSQTIDALDLLFMLSAVGEESP